MENEEDERIKLFTEEEVLRTVAKFAATYNTDASQWENAQDVLKDIKQGSTPIEPIGGKEYVQAYSVYIEDCGLQYGRYEMVLVPIEHFKGWSD